MSCSPDLRNARKILITQIGQKVSFSKYKTRKRGNTEGSGFVMLFCVVKHIPTKITVTQHAAVVKNNGITTGQKFTWSFSISYLMMLRLRPVSENSHR